MKYLLFSLLLILPLTFCIKHDATFHEFHPQGFFSMIVSRLSSYDFDLSKFGSDAREENNVHAHKTDKDDEENCDIDGEIKKLISGKSDDTLINHLLNLTTTAKGEAKGNILKTAYLKAGGGTEKGKFKFVLDLDKKWVLPNSTYSLTKKKLRSCEYTLEKCGIEDVRKEFIHASFDDVDGPYAVKGLVKSSIGFSVGNKDHSMSYSRNVLKTVVIVGLNQQSRIMGSYARVLTFGGAKMEVKISENNKNRNYLIESAESSIATIKSK